MGGSHKFGMVISDGRSRFSLKRDGNGSIKILSEPEFEREERPDMGGEVDARRLVLVKEPLYGCPAEQLSPEGFLRKENLPRIGL